MTRIPTHTAAVSQKLAQQSTVQGGTMNHFDLIEIDSLATGVPVIAENIAAESLEAALAAWPGCREATAREYNLYALYWEAWHVVHDPDNAGGDIEIHHVNGDTMAFPTFAELFDWCEEHQADLGSQFDITDPVIAIMREAEQAERGRRENHDGYDHPWVSDGRGGCATCNEHPNQDPGLAQVDTFPIGQCIGETIGPDEVIEPGSDLADPTKCFADVHVGRCPVLRYTEYLVRLPGGFEVAFERDADGETGARWRSGPGDTWRPITVTVTER